MKGFVIAGVGLTLILIVAVWVMGVMNGEVSLKNRFLAQEKAVETTYDTMWKTIKQKYQVNDKYEEAFKEGLKTLVTGRQGGSLFKMSGEADSQLGLPTDLYKDMMNTIEGKRAELKRSQDTLADIWREHKTYCEVMPNSFLVGNRVLPEPEMISSTITKEVIKSKKDDDISFE